MITAATPRQNERVQKAVAVLDDAIRQFNPQWVFALFSGGHDSLTSAYIASLHPAFSGCIHINTGIGIPATRQFVINTCAQHGWPLKEYRALDHCKADGTLDPKDYETMVLREGFPGPFGHQRMYNHLKERQLRRARKEHPGLIMFVSGQRQQESERRKRNVTTSFTQESKTLAWCRPIFDWSKSECSDALTAAGFKRNRVVLDLGKSGECLCGAFAKPGDLAAIRFACPATANRIEDLERRVRANGFPWGWEDPGPPQWWKEKNQGQSFMFRYDDDYFYPGAPEEHLCTSCKWRAL